MRVNWGPFQPVNDVRASIRAVHGNRLSDAQGKEYLDLISGLWNLILGYNDERLVEAVQSQMEQFSYLNPILFSSQAVEELSQKIASITHEDISKVYLTLSGSESVELAIKLARKYHSIRRTGKHVIAVMENSYHGSYYGSMSASDYESDQMTGYYPLLPGFEVLKLPFCRCLTNCSCREEYLDYLDHFFESNQARLGALIFEPVVASGGMIAIPAWAMQRIQKHCQALDILLVCDEVATGFGRTGSMFYFSNFQLKPDMVLMSKGMNNGMLPIGAVAIASRISQAFAEQAEILYHLSTQNANPLCCASANAMIDILLDEEQQIIPMIRSKADQFKEVLTNHLQGVAAVHEIRTYGLMIGIDLKSPHNHAILSEKHLLELKKALFEQGYLVSISHCDKVSATIILMPSIEITCDEIIIFVKKLKNLLLLKQADY